MKSTTKPRSTSNSARRTVSSTALGVRKRQVSHRRKKPPFANYTNKSSRRRKSRISFLKHSLLPTRANDYRPYLIRRWGLLAIALMILAVNVGYFLYQRSGILGDRTTITSQSLLAETNAARAKQGLGMLYLSEELQRAAAAKADDMIKQGYWSHNSPTGTTPWQFIENAGYRYSVAGENLARGYSTTSGVMQAWLDSPSHRANVLDEDYSDVGFAVVSGMMDDRPTTLIVAEYGRPVSAPNASTAGEVASASTRAAGIEDETFWAGLRRSFRNLTPSLFFTLIISGIATCVAVLAHLYRRQLPPKLRRTWYRHHGIIKICLIATWAVGVVLSYGNGVI